MKPLPPTSNRYFHPAKPLPGADVAGALRREYNTEDDWSYGTVGGVSFRIHDSLVPKDMRLVGARVTDEGQVLDWFLPPGQEAEALNVSAVFHALHHFVFGDHHISIKRDLVLKKAVETLTRRKDALLPGGRNPLAEQTNAVAVQRLAMAAWDALVDCGYADEYPTRQKRLDPQFAGQPVRGAVKRIFWADWKAGSHSYDRLHGMVPPAEADPEDLALRGLDEQQKLAVQKVLTGSLTRITGGPGRGKTRTVGAIVSIFLRQGLTVAVTAPTGRAAIRAKQLTIAGVPEAIQAEKQEQLRFVTLHKLLGVTPVRTERREEVHLPDLVVVDESSMLGSELVRELLRHANEQNTRVVFVGDPDQLPPPAPGRPFEDLEEVLPEATVELQTNYRQREGSVVAGLNERLKQAIRLRKDFLKASQRLKSFEGRAARERALGQDARALQAEVQAAKAEVERLQATYGSAMQAIPGAVLSAANAPDRSVAYYPDIVRDADLVRQTLRIAEAVDAQETLVVLTAYHTARQLNSWGLNERIHNIRHPDARTDVSIGEPIIFLRNDTLPLQGGGLIDVVNGDLGEVIEVLDNHAIIQVKTPDCGDGDGCTVRMALTDYRHAFVLAYVLTVHKAQGGEYQHVIALAQDRAGKDGGPEEGIDWGMRALYTAFTRVQDTAVNPGHLYVVGRLSVEALNRGTQRQDRAVNTVFKRGFRIAAEKAEREAKAAAEADEKEKEENL